MSKREEIKTVTIFADVQEKKKVLFAHCLNFIFLKKVVQIREFALLLLQIASSDIQEAFCVDALKKGRKCFYVGVMCGSQSVFKLL